MIEFPYSVAGFAVGAIVGLTGVGGGSLMTPLLVLGFGVPPVAAVGTDLLYAGITKAAGGSVGHALKGHIDWRITGRLAAGSIPATLDRARAPFRASARRRHHAARRLHGAGHHAGPHGVSPSPSAPGSSPGRTRNAGQWLDRLAPGRFATIAVGAFIGFAVTFSSVGAGAVGVTALMLLYPALATVKIVGSDIAHAVPITLIAGAGHALLGNVNVWLLASLLVGSIPGILLGTHLAAKLPERALRHSLVAVLLLAGTKLVLH